MVGLGMRGKWASGLTPHAPCLWVPAGVWKQNWASEQVGPAVQAALTCAGQEPHRGFPVAIFSQRPLSSCLGQPGL